MPLNEFIGISREAFWNTLEGEYIIKHCPHYTNLYQNNSHLEVRGYEFGALAGGMLGIVSPFFAYSILNEAHDHYLAGLLVATNLASGVYEFYRYNKNKVIQKRNSGLEKSVD